MLAIPEINGVDVAFGNIKHMPKCDDIPEDFRKERGAAKPFCDAVSGWFFNGAKRHPNGITVDGVNFTAKPGVDVQKALAAIKAALGSFEPSHEHKIAGCGFMLSEWFDIVPAAEARAGRR